MAWIFRRINRQKRRQRSSLLFGVHNSFNSMPHYRFSPWMIWRKRLIEERTLGRMNASEKWMIICWFTPHQPTTLPKWRFSQILFLGARWLVRLSRTPPDDLCLLFCLFLFLCLSHLQMRSKRFSLCESYSLQYDKQCFGSTINFKRFRIQLQPSLRIWNWIQL